MAKTFWSLTTIFIPTSLKPDDVTGHFDPAEFKG